jgi:hypothetical protein
MALVVIGSEPCSRCACDSACAVLWPHEFTMHIHGSHTFDICALPTCEEMPIVWLCVHRSHAQTALFMRHVMGRCHLDMRACTGRANWANGKKKTWRNRTMLWSWCGSCNDALILATAATLMHPVRMRCERCFSLVPRMYQRPPCARAQRLFCSANHPIMALHPSTHPVKQRPVLSISGAIRQHASMRNDLGKRRPACPRMPHRWRYL